MVNNRISYKGFSLTTFNEAVNMTVILFDVLNYFEKLKAAGFTEQQAKVQAEQAKLEADAVQQVIDAKLSTKKDIMELRTELKRDMKELEYKLTIRLGSMIIFSSLATISILGFLMKFGH